MNRAGHVGAVLLALSPFIHKLGIQFVVFAAIFTVLPDIDIILRVKHREYTHNITFGALLTLAAFFVFRQVGIPEILSLSVFVAVVIHIIVDAFTMQKFPPFYPFSRRRIAFKVFRGDNPAINAGYFILGALAFVYFAGGGYAG